MTRGDSAASSKGILLSPNFLAAASFSVSPRTFSKISAANFSCTIDENL
jgi:hypothetical protein